jgi:hypothetical protein
MARRKDDISRKEAKELGYRMIRVDNLELLFEYWALRDLGVAKWKRRDITTPNCVRMIHMMETTDKPVDLELARKLRALVRSRKAT